MIGCHGFHDVSEFPCVLHHQDEVHITVDRGANSTVVVEELLFGDLEGERERGREGERVHMCIYIYIYIERI